MTKTRQKTTYVEWDDLPYPSTDNNNGFIYGLNLLADNGEILDVEWFETGEEREMAIVSYDLELTDGSEFSL